MEPFFVTCETCRAKLKVRKAEAIGQILACPRCESMVHIVPPSDACAIDAAAAATSLRPRTQFARVETPSQQSADLFAAAAVAALASAPVHEFTDTGDAAQGDAAAVESAKLTSSATAGSAWSDALRGLWSTRPVALTSIAGAALLAVGGLTLAVWPSTDVVPTVATAPSVPARDIAISEPETATADELSAAVESTASPENAASPAAPSTLVESEVDTATLASSSHPAVAAVPIQVINDTPKVHQLSQVAPASAAATTDAGQQSRRDVPSPAPVRTQVFKFDPLDFDPQNLVLPPPGTSPTTTSPPVVSASAKLPADDATLAVADIPPLPPVEKPAAVASDTITVRRGTPTGDVATRQNVSAQLALPLRALSMKSVPLARFVEQMADMAGTPITFDPATVELTGISPQREITLDVKNTTIDRVLRETLNRHRMDFVEREGQITIIRAAASLPSKYDVSDLEATQVDSQALAKMIERFVVPESWTSAGGVGELRAEGTSFEIKNADESIIGVILFCERLRIARGLPVKSRYPLDRLSVESPYARIASRMKRSTTFTFVPWTRFVDVLRDWQTTSGTTILVDWTALAELELGSTAPVSCSAIDRTWGDALDGVLAPLGMGWWALDGETIQITSLERLAELRRVEFYAVSPDFAEQFADSHAMVAALKSELRATSSRERQPAVEVVMDVDQASGRLIVLGNAAAHRQITARLSAD